MIRIIVLSAHRIIITGPMRTLFLMLIRLYKYCLSPLLPVACRFTPTCSDYASDAVHTHGVFQGGLLACKRVLRCHPWGKEGYDPVPIRQDIKG